MFGAPFGAPGYGPPPVAGPTFGGMPPIIPVQPTIAERFYIRGEYLHWWTEGMEAPPLVTTSPAGTPRAQAAVLGEPNTTVLFGGEELNGDTDNGFRVRSGLWLTPQNSFGIEGEYFQLFGQDDSFAASGDGAPILGRPFFDITNDQETAQLVSFPGVVAGDVRVSTETDLQSILLNARVALDAGSRTPYPVFPPPNRIDWLVGYRYLELNDSLAIVDNLESLDPDAPGTVVASESFRTSNEFHGLQLGVLHQLNLNRFWLESMLRVALGNNTQNVRVRGTTAITESGITETYTGNLLAQRTNIGDREEDEFTMIPELGLTLGFRLTERLHATVGYSVLYFPNVVRAAEQIDTDVNPNLIPPEADPFTGSLRPRPLFETNNYWAHGLSAGGEFRF